MKRFAILILLVSLAAAAAMGDEYNYGFAVRTSTLTRTMLQNLDFSGEQVEEILRMQNRYMAEKTVRNGKIAVLKLKLAEEFNSSDASTRKINRLVRRINQHNLDQDLEQVRLYQQTRHMFGEERWSEVVRGSNAQDPIRTMTEDPIQEQTRDQTQEQLQSKDGSGSDKSEPSGTPSGNSSGSGSSSGRN